jgi:hypothetical protein
MDLLTLHNFLANDKTHAKGEISTQDVKPTGQPQVVPTLKNGLLVPSAKFWGIINMNAVNDSKPANHIWAEMDSHSDQKSMQKMSTSLPTLFPTEMTTMMNSLRFFIKEPLFNASSVIPQLILNFCTGSIAMCNKLFNQMTPFNGDKIRHKITVKVGAKTFSWMFDTGAAATCMNATSFFAAFPNAKPKNI